MKRHPRARSDLRTQDAGTEVLLYDQETDKIHILNETAVQVWQLCDGRHERKEIVDELARRYPDVDRQIVSRDVERLVEDFETRGLLEQRLPEEG